MRSTFFGIETQRRAILSQRKVMDTIGHNVANAATKGYTRQDVTLTATRPFAYPGTSGLYGPGQIGTGVITAEVRRIRDVFVDNQLRSGMNDTAQLQVEKNTLQQIENVFMEPSSTEGLNNALSGFFDAWQEMSKRPENVSTRNQVLSSGQNLTTVINNIDQTLRQIRIDLNGQLVKDVEIVNAHLQDIATLTKQIAKVQAAGDMPNDLLDKRDLLLDELSSYVNFDVMDSEYPGGIAISIGGRELLRNDHVYELSTDPAWDHPSQNTQTPYMRDVSQADYEMLARFSKGELKGLINSRDQIVTAVQKSFQELVATIANTYNNLHSVGLGIGQQDYTTVATSTAAMTDASNYIEVAPTATQLFSVGEKLYVSDPRVGGNTSNAITVEISAIDSVNGRLYFIDRRSMDKGQEIIASNPTSTTFSIGAGAEIRKMDIDKYNFFITKDVLPRSMIGDAVPEYTSQMTSALTLPPSVTLNTTIRELELMLGVDIVDPMAVNSKLHLENNTFTGNLTENMTLGDVFREISSIHPTGIDPLKIELDTINHKVIISGESATALSQLGGLEGSSNNLFRILGFEGYNVTGFQLQDGAQLSTTLKNLGVSEGWLQIDNTLVRIDDTDITLKSALDKINATLAAAPGSKNTNVLFDAGLNRLRIVSDHMFATVTPSTAAFPTTPPAIRSNMLIATGLLRSENDPTYSAIQQKVSVTTSDIGARIAVNDDLLTDLTRLATAASYAGLPGDNSIAIELAGLKNMFIMGDTSKGALNVPNQTMDDFYNNLIAEIGVKAQTTIMNSEAADKFVEFYQNKREEVSGVSIDEEMTKLIEAQHSFSAASRIINTVDQMLDRIINGTGLAGR